jgi:branched-subunit amino acid ABC-type transport system permease component
MISSLLPYLANGLSLGLSISLVALAMALIWRTVGIIDFGLGAVYLTASYATLFLRKTLGLPLALSIIGALAAGVAAAILIYAAVYRGFIRRNAPLFVMVLVGISVFQVIQNLLGAILSAQKFYFIDTILPGVEILGTRLNFAQFAKMGVSVLALAGVAYFCLKTRPGTTILAVADNKRLAQAMGISIDRAYAWTFGLAGLIVSAAAIPDVAETGVYPFVAINPIFLALAAIIIGGLSNFRSPVLGAVLLGLAFHLAVWVLPASWQEVIAYGFVVIVLVARPQGLFGGLNLVRERA